MNCHASGDLGRAEYLYCKLVAHAEDHSAAYFGLGTIYAQCHLHGRAITFLKKAIELQPDGNGAMENLAAVYREMEKRDQARYWGERALSLAKTPLALANYSGTYINDGNPELALKWAEEAIALKPLPQALNHKALALLELGRFEEGWEVYDARLDLPQIHRRPYKAPMWDGKPVKRLAIHGEQGLGDEILFLTCLAQLKDRAEEIAIECAGRLVKLVQNSFPFAKVYATHEELISGLGEPDAWIAMGSLPRLCWPVVPNTYLRPTKQLPKLGKVGLSWKGGTLATHQVLRNAPIELWKTFTDLDCISLQYGDEEENAKILGVPHDPEAIADLDHLAALIKSCDLVITVCNTTVHLAGALGVPCIVLVPSAPAWRYGMKGELMVWYDSIRMVRQRDGEAWASVMQRAKERAIAYLRELSGTEQSPA